MENMCYKLHSLFNGMKRYTFETLDCIPFDNGIYVFFQIGETYAEFDRIVRVGTDTGQNQLKSRMRQHFVNENKDRSIFRKNIGRAILAKQNSPLLEYWNLDLTPKKNRERYFDADKSTQCETVEASVSDFMKQALSFVVFPLEKKEDRLRFEEAIIATLYHSADFKASNEWLGNFVPQSRCNHVREARMWLSQGLKAKPLTDVEFEQLVALCAESPL